MVTSQQPIPEQIKGKLASACVYPEFFSLKAKQKVLNVGCGSCAQVVAYGPVFSSMIGIDVQTRQLKKAQEVITHYQLPVRLCRALAESLPLKSDVFDAILAIDLIEHVKDPKQVICEFYRVFKKEGRLLITFPAMHDYFVDVIRFLRKIFVPFYKGKSDSQSNNWDAYKHNQEFSLKKWLRMMEEGGFKIVASRASTLFPPLHLYGIPRFWFTWKWLHRLDTYFCSLPVLRRLGQALVCIYEK